MEEDKIALITGREKYKLKIMSLKQDIKNMETRLRKYEMYTYMIKPADLCFSHWFRNMQDDIRYRWSCPQECEDQVKRIIVFTINDALEQNDKLQAELELYRDAIKEIPNYGREHCVCIVEKNEEMKK